MIQEIYLQGAIGNTTCLWAKLGETILVEVSMDEMSLNLSMTYDQADALCTALGQALQHVRPVGEPLPERDDTQPMFETDDGTPRWVMLDRKTGRVLADCYARNEDAARAAMVQPWFADTVEVGLAEDVEDWTGSLVAR